MRLSKNKTTIINIVSTLLLQGLTFFSGPIFSNVLGTENYGIAAVYLSWVTLASTVFSLQAAGTLAVAQVSFSEDRQTAYQSSVLSLATISYIFFSALTLVFIAIVQIWYEFNILMVLLGLIQGWGMYCVSTMNLKLTYEFKADKNLILSVLTSGLTIGLSILLIYCFPSENNYWGRILGQVIVYTVIGGFIYFIIYKSGKTFYNRDYWKFTIPIAIPTVFHLLASIVLNQSDKVMLQNMLGNSEAGVYALAATFGAVVQSIFNALNNSWVPYYYDYTKNGKISEIRIHSKNYIELFSVIIMGYIFLSREVFHLYANESFWQGTDLIPLFAISHYFVFLYSFPVNYEFYHKKTKTIAIGTIMAAICNMVLNYILIRLWGIIGATIATTISHGLQFIFHYISATHMKASIFPFKMLDFAKSFLWISLSALIYWLTRDQWFIRWGIGALIGVYIVIKILRRKEFF